MEPREGGAGYPTATIAASPRGRGVYPAAPPRTPKRAVVAASASAGVSAGVSVGASAGGAPAVSPRRRQQQQNVPEEAFLCPLSPRTPRGNAGHHQQQEQQQVVRLPRAAALPKVPLAAVASAPLSPERRRQMAAAGVNPSSPLALLSTGIGHYSNSNDTNTATPTPAATPMATALSPGGGFAGGGFAPTPPPQQAHHSLSHSHQHHHASHHHHSAQHTGHGMASTAGHHRRSSTVMMGTTNGHPPPHAPPPMPPTIHIGIGGINGQLMADEPSIFKSPAAVAAAVFGDEEDAFGVVGNGGDRDGATNTSGGASRSLFGGGGSPRHHHRSQSGGGGASSSSAAAATPSGGGGASGGGLRTFDKATGKLVRVSSKLFVKARVLAHEQYIVDRATPARLAEASRRVKALPFQEQFELARRRFYRGATMKSKGRLAKSGGVFLFGDDDYASSVAAAPSSGGISGGGFSGGGANGGSTATLIASTAEPTIESFYAMLNAASPTYTLPATSPSSSMPPSSSQPLRTGNGVDIFGANSNTNHNGANGNTAAAAIHARAVLETHAALGDIASHLGKPTESIGLAKIHRAAVDQFIFESCQQEARRHLLIVTNNLLPADLAPVDLLKLQLDAYRHQMIPAGPRQNVTGVRVPVGGGGGALSSTSQHQQQQANRHTLSVGNGGSIGALPLMTGRGGAGGSLSVGGVAGGHRKPFPEEHM